MNGASRMELRLAVLLGDTAIPPPPPVVAFWAEWARAGGSAMPDIAAFRAEVAKPGGVIMLLHRIRRALVKLGWFAAQSTPPPDARPLITALTLAAADVYARNHAALAQLDAGAPLQMRFKSALAAALVAASRFDRNLRIVRDASCDEGLRAANVLTESEAEELAFVTTRQACEAELLAATQAMQRLTIATSDFNACAGCVTRAFRIHSLSGWRWMTMSKTTTALDGCSACR